MSHHKPQFKKGPSSGPQLVPPGKLPTHLDELDSFRVRLAIAEVQKLDAQVSLLQGQLATAVAHLEKVRGEVWAKHGMQFPDDRFTEDSLLIIRKVEPKPAPPPEVEEVASPPIEAATGEDLAPIAPER